MTAPNELYANSVSTTLANGINAAATAILVAAGTGGQFPNPTVGTQVFRATLIDNATKLIKEIVLVTARSVDTLTVVRGQEGTTAVAWNAGDLIKMLVTSGTMNNLIQLPQAQAQTYKYAQDTGGVNGVVAALSPAVTTRIPGLEINVKIAANNTGPSTLNLGAGSVQIVNPDGSDLGSGALIAGGVATFIDTGSGPYQLISASQELQTASGLATTGDIKWRPTTETLTGWVPACSSTIGGAASNAVLRANVDCANLFAWHWNNFSNSQCPVYTSAGVITTRGANAAADFAANKQIAVVDLRGTVMCGMDNMAGFASTYLTGVPAVFGNSTTSGSVLGENLHTLTVAELASHAHGVTDPGHSHTFRLGVSTTFGPLALSALADNNSEQTQVSVTGITIQNNGGDSPHNNVERVMVGTFYIKL